MKKKLTFLLLLCLYIGVAFAQENLILSPKNFQPGQDVDFTYSPKDTPLDSSLVVSAVVNFFEKTGRFRKPIDLILNREGDQWKGKFTIPYNCVSYLIIFKDENDMHDNYDGHGYRYILKDKDGKELIGGKAAIAKYCFINPNYVPYVYETWRASCVPDLEKGREMLEEEFSKHEELVTHYIREYSNSINLSNPEEKKALLEKTDWLYEQIEQLDSHTLRGLSYIYLKLGDLKKDINCRKVNLKNYPNSNWAFQYNSRHLQRSLREASTLNEKLRVYKKMEKYFEKGLKEGDKTSILSLEKTLSVGKISEEHLQSFTWIQKNNYYQTEKLVILSKYLPAFLEQGKKEKWFELVENIDAEWCKFRLYDNFAKHQIKASNHNENDTLAIALINKIINISTNKLDSSRSFREIMFSDITDNDIRRKREIDLAEYWMTKAEILLKIGKEADATYACNKAIEYGNLAPTIFKLNDRIVEFLLKIGDEAAAREVSKLAIAKGTASSKMKS